MSSFRLRPTSAPQQGQPAPEGEGSLETDDLLAVKEVKLAYENMKVVDCLDLYPEGSAAWEATLKRFVDMEWTSLLLLELSDYMYRVHCPLV